MVLEFGVKYKNVQNTWHFIGILMIIGGNIVFGYHLLQFVKPVTALS